MTPDDYTTAAQDEAAKRWPHLPHRPETHTLNVGKRVGFDLGASWARVYLTQQEPTEDEVDAAATAICSGENGCDPCFNWDESVEGGCTYCARHARAALRAARGARVTTNAY